MTVNNNIAADHPNGRLYCTLMEYIKWRVGAVLKTTRLVQTKKHYLENHLAAEFCLLQLRMCCELLAIGCVAIHTDIPQTSRLKKMWNADLIMKAFEKLKPEFFPQGSIDETRPEGLIQQHAAQGAMSKQDFMKAYNLFGGMLHTGTFQHYERPSVGRRDFSIIEDFLDKFIKLLNNHVYFLDNNKAMVRIIMNNSKDGRVAYNYLVGIRITDSESAAMLSRRDSEA